MSTEDLVSRAVHLQRTSPNFAEYCITHVTAPTHQFLYSFKDTPERRLYLRLLDRARTEPAGRNASDAPERRDHKGAVPSFFCFASAEPRTGEASAFTTADIPRFSEYDVRVLYENMGELFTYPVATATRKHVSGKRGRSESDVPAPVVGPHAPHLFSGTAALRRFLVNYILPAAENPEKANTEAAVLFMAQSLPQTEAFLYVLLYVCEEFVSFSGRRKAQEEQSAVQQERREPSDPDTANLSFSSTMLCEDEGEVTPCPPLLSWTSYVEGATAVLFIADRLLSVHRERESILLAATAAAPCVGTSSGGGWPCRAVYYQAVFDRYLSRMVEAFLRSPPSQVCTAAPAEGNCDDAPSHNSDTPTVRAAAEAAQFVLDIVRVWSVDGALHVPNTADRLAEWERRLQQRIAPLTHSTRE